MATLIFRFKRKSVNRFVLTILTILEGSSKFIYSTNSIKKILKVTKYFRSNTLQNRYILLKIKLLWLLDVRMYIYICIII